MPFTFPELASFSLLVGALIAGSFGEEVGWRGLGQPRLQTRFGALTAAVIVGILWSAWHLWPVLAPGGLGSTEASDVVLTFVRLIAMAIVYAWLYNSTRGSLLIVMIAHAGYDMGVNLVPGANGNHAGYLRAGWGNGGAIVYAGRSAYSNAAHLKVFF